MDPRPQGYVTVGSDFAGLLTVGLALAYLNMPHLFAFVAETCPKALAMAREYHRVCPGVPMPDRLRGLVPIEEQKEVQWFSQERTAANEAPRVDVYVFGFPYNYKEPLICALRRRLEYIKRNRPYIVLLEESEYARARRVRCAECEELWPRLTDMLGSWGYTAQWALVAAFEQGVPHFKSTWYLLAVRAKRRADGNDELPFWPGMVPGGRQLADFLEARDAPPAIPPQKYFAKKQHPQGS
jgi:hypothetical protein